MNSFKWINTDDCVCACVCNANSLTHIAAINVGWTYMQCDGLCAMSDDKRKQSLKMKKCHKCWIKYRTDAFVMNKHVRDWRRGRRMNMKQFKLENHSNVTSCWKRVSTQTWMMMANMRVRLTINCTQKLQCETKRSRVHGESRLQWKEGLIRIHAVSPSLPNSANKFENFLCDHKILVFPTIATGMEW